MNDTSRGKQCFLLRLPCSVRAEAIEVAQSDGISLNHFIGLAVAEKLMRMQQPMNIPSSPVHRLPAANLYRRSA